MIIRIFLTIGFSFCLPKSAYPKHYAANVKVPTFIIRVRDDFWSRPEDVQTTFAMLTVEDEKLFWVEGINKRFDGYNYFGDTSAQMIECFDSHMK